jgi:predicted O-methyltransferase YrrM
LTEEINQPAPKHYRDILQATQALDFKMSSDILTCSLLRTLAATKPSGKFLELGTGTGLSTSWILDGMTTSDSTLTSIDNDPRFLEIAVRFLGADHRLKLEVMDGEEWILANKHRKFDYIFADTWHGKYLLLNEVLEMLMKGGLYIIDDMIPQANWPEGHQEKVSNLLHYLDAREDLLLTRQCWATGIVIAVKK